MLLTLGLQLVFSDARASSFQVEPGKVIPHPAAASTVIVVGIVTEEQRYVPPPEQPSGITLPGRRRLSLEVEETIKGPAVKQVYIDVPGGFFFELKVGEKVLAHLMPFDASPFPDSLQPVSIYGIYRPVDMACGVMSMQGETLLVSSYPEDTREMPIFFIPPPQEGGVLSVRSVEDSDVCKSLEWDELLSAVRAAARSK
jgi:hypothetical protein